MNTLFFPTKPRRWMLVDDNRDVLAMLSLFVREFTDAAIECHSDPHEALGAFIAQPDAYEVVITDFEMPEMDGVELCRRLHKINSAQKVILATGSGFFTPAAAQHAGFGALLNKPFQLAQLQTALTDAGVTNEASCAA